MANKRIKDLANEANSSTLDANQYAVVDGSTGTFKTKLSALADWILGRIKNLTTTATEADLTSSNYIPLDGSAGSKKLPGDAVAPKSVQGKLSASIAPEFNASKSGGYKKYEFVMHEGELFMAKSDVAQGAWDSSKWLSIDESMTSALSNDNFIKFIRDDAFVRVNGEEVVNTDYSLTDYIPCNSFGYILTNCAVAGSIASSIAFFDSSKTFISYNKNTSASTLAKVSIPSTAKYVRFSFQKTLFVGEKPVFFGRFIDTSRTGIKYDFDGDYNMVIDFLFKQSVKFTEGYFLASSTGGLSTNANYVVSDMFEVIPEKFVYTNASATGSAAAIIAFYDSSKTFISSVVQRDAQRITRSQVPATAKYARFSCMKAELSTTFFRGDYFAIGNIIPLYNLSSDLLEINNEIDAIDARVSSIEDGEGVQTLPEWDINHVITIGQSLSVMGGDTNSVHTAINSYRLSAASNTVVIPITSGASGASLVSITSPYAPANEYPVIAENEYICKSRPLEEGETLNDYGYATIMTAWGSGGVAISTIISNFNNLKSIFSVSKELVNDLGKSYLVPAINWIQGEHESRCTETQAASYCSTLLGFFKNIQDYVVATTGQTDKPKMVTYQLSSYATYNNGNKRMTLPVAMLKFVRDNENEIALGAVTYQLPYQSDRLHLDEYGSRMLGMLMGVAFNEFVYKGNKKPYIYLKNHTVQNYGSKYVVILEFNVPYGKLVFDHNSPIDGNPLKFYDYSGNEVSVANEGFEFMNSDWNYNGTEGSGSDVSPVVENWSVQNIITGVSIKRGKYVEIVCSADPTGMELWYARRGNQGGGFLRDSRGDEVTVNINQRTCRLDNYCPLFMITV